VLVLAVGVAHADKIVEIHDLEVAGVLGPPPEVAALAKQLAGKWTCKGTEHLAGGATRPVTAKLAVELVLGDAWVRYSTTDAGNLTRETYRTYDAVAKQWTQIEVSARGRHAVSTSLGPEHDTWTWQGDGFTLRDRTVATKRGLEVTREGLFELTCSKQ